MKSHWFKPTDWRLVKDQAGAWQLTSVNVNRHFSADTSVIVEKLLKLARKRAHLLVINFQETRSWDVLNLKLPGYVCSGSKFGLATLMVQISFSN